MKLDDAELQQTTGFPIAMGCLRIGSDTDMAALGINAHDHVLLSSSIDRPLLMDNLQHTTTFWPVASVTRNEHGFRDATLGEAGLALHWISLEDIGDLSRSEEGRATLTRGGFRAGALIRREWTDYGWREKSRDPIDRYELNTASGAEGLHITISGQIAGNGNMRGRAFSADVMVPWHTLELKGFRFGGTRKFMPEDQRPTRARTVPETPRDPRKMSDLLVQGGGFYLPFLKGHILFVPDISGLSSLATPADQFVSVQFGHDDVLHFADAPRLEVLDTLFAQSRGSENYLTISILGRKKLESALNHRDSFYSQKSNAVSLQSEGNALGSVRYKTGYADEYGDPLGWIHQPMKSLSLIMQLGKDGLDISADGELAGFDPDEFAVHRQMRNSQLKPFRAYSLRATMPWALLAVMEFSFADRARNF